MGILSSIVLRVQVLTANFLDGDGIVGLGMD